MNISDLRKEPHLSASAINDYIDCGLLYKLGRIDKLPPEFRSSDLEFGSVIHKTLEAYYRHRLEAETLSIKTLHEIFEKGWKEMVEGRKITLREVQGKRSEYPTRRRSG
jgi:putative RecB family exonuclease